MKKTSKAGKGEHGKRGIKKKTKRASKKSSKKHAIKRHSVKRQRKTKPKKISHQKSRKSKHPRSHKRPKHRQSTAETFKETIEHLVGRKPSQPKKPDHKTSHKKHAKPKEHHEKPRPHKGRVHGKGKMEVEFVTRVPDGKPKRIRHKMNEYSDVLRLETNIDKLYKLVCKDGEVKVREAAGRFGVDIDLVEEWGRVLENHDLARMHYPAFGELVIRSMKWVEQHSREKRLEEKRKEKEEKKKHKEEEKHRKMREKERERWKKEKKKEKRKHKKKK